MSNPFSVARLATFTISLLLLTQSIDPGWGIDGSWGWYFALVFLAAINLFDTLNFVTFVLAWLLLLGLIDASNAVFIALTIFSGAGLMRRLFSRPSHRNQFTWYTTTRRFGPPSAN